MEDFVSAIVGDILSWKKEYGNVYLIKIGDRKYVYRTLSRSDYLALLASQDKLQFDIEDVILEHCLLSPKFNKHTFDGMPAGETDFLVRCISSSSGFSEMDRIEKDIEESRQALDSLENQIIILICKAFPHLTLKDINNFTYDEIIRHLTISEAILDVKLNIEKPKPKNQGTVDFDEENKVMGGVPFDRNLNIPRGDVRK